MRQQTIIGILDLLNADGLQFILFKCPCGRQAVGSLVL